MRSRTIGSYREGFKLALRGRTYDGPDRGKRIDRNTWLFFHEGDNREPESYLRLQLHGTDLVHMYEDRIVFMCDGWNTMTTQMRLADWTPFSVCSVFDKYRAYFSGASSYARLHLQGAPHFYLTWEPGVTCTWDGHWVRTPDQAGEYVELCLPVAGARSRARKTTNALRKELRGYMSMLQDQRPRELPDPPPGAVFGTPWDYRGNWSYKLNKLLVRWAKEGDLDKELKDYVVDLLLHTKGPTKYVDDHLKDTVTPDLLYNEEMKEHPVHYTMVDKLLKPRGPEWPEGMDFRS